MTNDSLASHPAINVLAPLIPINALLDWPQGIIHLVHWKTFIGNICISFKNYILELHLEAQCAIAVWEICPKCISKFTIVQNLFILQSFKRFCTEYTNVIAMWGTKIFGSEDVKKGIKEISLILTHLSLDKMAAILQTMFSDAFLWMKSFVFWLEYYCSLFLRVQLTVTKHWFR